MIDTTDHAKPNLDDVMQWEISWVRQTQPGLAIGPFIPLELSSTASDHETIPTAIYGLQ